jgi:type I restriction enzyme S subunit
VNVVSLSSAFPKTVQPGLPKLGDLPEGWVRAPIGKFLHEVRRPVKMIDEHEYRLVTVKRARGGVEERSKLLGSEVSVKSQFALEEGDFLISKRQIVHGACGLVPADLAGSTVSNEYSVLNGNGEIDLPFLNYLAHSVFFQQTCFHSSIGVHIEKMIFKLDRWLKFEFDLPPLAEQRKIADILSTWDQAIEKTEALLSNARTQKRALMQQLLTGKRRFPAYEGQPWKEVRIRDLVNLSPKMDVCPYDRRLTFLTMDAVTEEAMIAKPIEGNWDTHVKGFTQFKDGDILVAKITPCFENGKGCHASNLINGIGTGSTEFHVLRPKDVRDARFIFHVTNSYEFRGRGALNMQGSAGQRRVPTDFIRAYPLTVPENPDARQRIGSLLDDASNEIQHHHLQITKLRTEKKALMQQLLTGKRRVVV